MINPNGSEPLMMILKKGTLRRGNFCVFEVQQAHFVTHFVTLVFFYLFPDEVEEL
jgi:hypothetical protein